MNFLICTDITGFNWHLNVAQIEGANAIAVPGTVPIVGDDKGVL